MKQNVTNVKSTKMCWRKYFISELSFKNLPYWDNQRMNEGDKKIKERRIEKDVAKFASANGISFNAIAKSDFFQEFSIL